MQHPKIKPLLFRLYPLLVGILFFNVSSEAQSSKQSLADSLYFKTGEYEQASQLYLELASEWETKGIIDSAIHKYLFAIKALGQANLIEPALDMCVEVLEKMQKYPQAIQYRADIYYEKGYCELVMGDRASCIQSLNISLESEGKKERPDSLKIAGILQFKGLALLQSGDVEQGRGIVVEAHQIRSRLLEEDHIDLAQSANMVYMIYDHLNQYQKADEYISEAYRIMKKNLDPSHPHFAIIINNYSNVRRNLGDPFHAKDLLSEAIASNESAQRWYPLTMNYYNLADLYFDFGEYELSDLYFSKSLEMGDTLLANPSLERSNLYDGLGKIAFQLERHVEADRFFKLALRQNLQLVGEQSLEVAQSYHNLGLIAFSQKNYPQAIRNFQKSSQLRSQLLIEHHPLVMDSESALGDCLWELGQKQAAFEKWRSCLNHLTQKLGKQNPKVVTMALQLARTWEKEQEPDSVEYYLKRAWAGVISQDSTSDDWSVEQAGDFQLFHLISFELIDFHLAYLLNSAVGSPHSFLLVEALINKFNVFLTQMLPLLNSQQSGPELRSLLQRIYSNAALIAHRKLMSEADGMHQFYLACLENSKAFSIRAQLQNRNALSFSKIPDSLQSYGQYLQSRFWAINAFKATNEELTTDLVQQEIEIQTSWNQWQQQLAQQYPEYYKLRYAKPQMDFTPLGKKLQENHQSLVGYFLCDQSLLVLSYDGQQFITKEIAIQDGRIDSIASFNQLLNNRSFSDRLPRLAHYLYQAFFQPIEKELRSNVLIVPDGALSNLNFDLLLQHLPENKTAYRDMDWLIKKYSFQYANHLQTSKPENNDNQFNLAIAPGFSSELKSEYLTHINPEDQADSVFLNWVSTPWSLALVNELAKKGWGEILTDTAATKSRFLSLSENVNVLHFATHAEVNDRQPLQSFLALTPSPLQNDDGYLYASDLYGLNLNSNLVVLSACQTGLGNFQQGEGVLSLAHAFQYAGVPAMVYSLWSIDDQQTNRLIEDFYLKLGKKSSVSQALRQAKLSYLLEHSGDLTHPYYWGGLVMMGDDQHISRKKSDFFHWGYILGFLLVSASLFYFFKKR